MSLLIRDANLGDAAAIARIYNALLATTTIVWTDIPHTEAQRRAWLEDQQSARLPVLVAEEDSGAVVGWASYAPFRDNNRWPGFRFTVEHSIYVDKAAWGSGVGRTLIETLIGRATDAGLHVMVAGIDGNNVNSIRFHERLGFVEAGRLHQVGHKHELWLDLVYMQRLLP